MLKRFWLVMLAMLVLSGCDEALAPLPAPTDTPTAPLLSESYDGTDSFGGRVSLGYPQGWLIPEDASPDALVIFNDATLSSEALTGTLASGQVGVGVNVVPEGLAVLLIPEGEAVTLPNLLDGFLANLAEGEGDDAPNFSAPTPLNLGGVEALRTEASEATGDGLILALDRGRAYVIVVASTAPGELERYEPTVRAIAASVRYATQLEAAD